MGGGHDLTVVALALQDMQGANICYNDYLNTMGESDIF